jgi:peroxiredoxin
VKRNTIVLGVTLLLLATFAWAGWANWEYRKQAAERALASASHAELVPSVAGDVPSQTSLVGKPAPDFVLENLSGQTVSLSSFKGKPLLINFWATWCGPCTTETPQFDAIYRANKGKPVQFLGVDTKDNRDSAKAFVKDNDITFPIVFDEKGETAVRLGRIPALGLPFTVLVDKQQRVAAVYMAKLTAKDLQPVLDKLVAES